MLHGILGRGWLEGGNNRSRLFRDGRCFRIDDQDPFSFPDRKSFAAANRQEMLRRILIVLHRHLQPFRERDEAVAGIEKTNDVLRGVRDPSGYPLYDHAAGLPLHERVAAVVGEMRRVVTSLFSEDKIRIRGKHDDLQRAFALLLYAHNKFIYRRLPDVNYTLIKNLQANRPALGLGIEALAGLTSGRSREKQPRREPFDSGGPAAKRARMAAGEADDDQFLTDNAALEDLRRRGLTD